MFCKRGEGRELAAEGGRAKEGQEPGEGRWCVVGGWGAAEEEGGEHGRGLLSREA